jgi:hypothetical protein
MTQAYVLLESVHITVPKILTPCDNINPILLETFNEVSDNVPHFYIGMENNTGIFCNHVVGHYGYTVPYDIYTDISIKNELLFYPNTLYNVALHEVLHSMGLDHNDGGKGMMNYSMTKGWWGGIKDDERKLWLSEDDLSGLYYLRTR